MPMAAPASAPPTNERAARLGVMLGRGKFTFVRTRARDPDGARAGGERSLPGGRRAAALQLRGHSAERVGTRGRRTRAVNVAWIFAGSSDQRPDPNGATARASSATLE